MTRVIKWCNAGTPDANHVHIGNGKITLRLGREIKTVYGGPYRNRPGYLSGVKLVKELDMPCNVSCPIEDYNIPDKKTATLALYETFDLIHANPAVYVGCMGGWGRTGLFLALLVKITAELYPDEYGDPVAYVRKTYSGRAVETEEQEAFVANYPARRFSLAARWLPPRIFRWIARWI